MSLFSCLVKRSPVRTFLIFSSVVSIWEISLFLLCDCSVFLSSRSRASRLVSSAAIFSFFCASVIVLATGFSSFLPFTIPQFVSNSEGIL